MLRTTTDLWPQEFGALSVVTPVTILREQATFLSKKTQTIVEAYVRTLPADENTEFHHRFELVAPALNDYVYPLFQIWHDVNLYPVHIDFYRAGKDPVRLQAENSNELQERLRMIFADEETKRVIQLLIAQSTA